MDDPVFDPWGPGIDPSASEARGTSAPRWRSPEAQRPTVPSPEREQPRQPEVKRMPPDAVPAARPASRSRLSGAPGFLRTMAVPRLQDAAQRLTMARHEARVDDLLDSPSPLVRLVIQPWQGPLERPGAAEGCLEIRVEEGDQSKISLRSRLREGTGDSMSEEAIGIAKLSAPWLDTRILAFVARLFSEV